MLQTLRRCGRHHLHTWRWYRKTYAVERACHQGRG